MASPKSPSKQNSLPKINLSNSGLSKSSSSPSLGSSKSSLHRSPKQSNSRHVQTAFGADPQSEIRGKLRQCLPLIGRVHYGENFLFCMPTDSLQGTAKLWVLVEFGLQHAAWEEFSRAGKLAILASVAALCAEEYPPLTPPVAPPLVEESEEAPAVAVESDDDNLDASPAAAAAPAADEEKQAPPEADATEAGGGEAAGEEAKEEDKDEEAEAGGNKRNIYRIARSALRNRIEQMRNMGRCVRTDEAKAILLARLCKFSLKLPGPARLILEALDGVSNPEYNASHKAVLMETFGNNTPRVCMVEEGERRAITLSQLSRVRAFCTEHCRSWHDTDLQSLTYGKHLNERLLNLHHVNSWVLLPSTERNCCSFVELLASAAQPAELFVSHWWGERHFDFLDCVESFWKMNQLKDNTGFWICAYANRQHLLAYDITPDPNQSTFYRAMALANFRILVVLNANCEGRKPYAAEAMPFQRIWCAFEIFKCLGQLEPDMNFATRTSDGVHLLTAKLLPSEEKKEVRQIGEGVRAKMRREANFPKSIAALGLTTQLELARSSVEVDRARILNSLVGRAAHELDLPPLERHENFDRTNVRLNGIFAQAFLRLAATQPSGGLAAGVRKAMKEDAECSKLQLRLGGCSGGDDDHELAFVMSCLPALVKELVVNLGGSSITDVSLEVLARKLPDSVDVLELSLAHCQDVTDAGFCKVISTLSERQQRGKPLENMMLDLRGSGISKRIQEMEENPNQSPDIWLGRIRENPKTNVLLLQGMLAPFTESPLQDKDVLGQIVDFCKRLGCSFTVEGPYGSNGGKMAIQFRKKTYDITVNIDETIVDCLLTNGCRLYVEAGIQGLRGEIVSAFIWNVNKSLQSLPAFNKKGLPEDALRALEAASLTQGTPVHVQYPLSSDLQEKSLIYAARCNDVETVKECLTLATSTSSRLASIMLDTARSSPTADGIENLESQDPETVSAILSGPAMVNAAWNGSREVLELLLEHKADIEGCEERGWTSLMAASFAGHTEVVELLLNHGAIAQAAGADGKTALEIAALNGHEAVVAALLSAVDFEEEVVNRAKEAAISRGYMSIVDTIVVQLRFRAANRPVVQIG